MAIGIREAYPLDCGRIGYFGTSWGGMLGAILPAVEKRIRTNVLYVAGLSFQRSLSEVDAVHYVTRVTQPTLMLNDELDFFFPAETTQRPMFELLGTPPEHKRRITYARGHTVPKVELIKETLAWLERYHPFFRFLRFFSSPRWERRGGSRSAETMLRRCPVLGGDMAKCPHCKQPVTLEKTRRETGDLPDAVHKDVVGFVKKEIMYSCPHCDAVLGFGYFFGGLLTGRP